MVEVDHQSPVYADLGAAAKLRIFFAVVPHPRHFLFLAILGALVFAVLAVLVASESAIVRVDRWISEQCHHFTINRPAVRELFRIVTNLGWGRVLTCAGTVTAIALIVRREWFRALVWTAGQLVVQEIVPSIKDQFERPRPEFADVDGFSFPSGHALGSAVVYGLLGLLMLRIWRGSRWRWLWAGLIWAIIPLVALSRIMLGVHFFSDVLAGSSLGLGWAFGCAALADWWDSRRASPNTPAAALPTQLASSETDARTSIDSHVKR
jgi:membrane-associated phospholipid phosphatase